MPDKDNEAIRIKLEELENKRLNGGRNWLPKYLYHFTDVKNAASILTEGSIYSRLKAKGAGLMLNDNASSEIISGTDLHKQSFVRLFFRPKTPTQYHNEGVKSINDPSRLNAHCPVPVFLLFDAYTLLTDKLTSFSNGNLASEGVLIDKTTNFYLSLPFEKIYHEGILSEENKRELIFHRQAEVLYPEQMTLQNLKFIICRSQAELETLRYLMPDFQRAQYSGKMKADNIGNFFFKNRTYINKVSLIGSELQISFNYPEKYPYTLEITINDLAETVIYQSKAINTTLEPAVSISKKEFLKFDYLMIEIRLDDNLVYRNSLKNSQELLY